MLLVHVLELSFALGTGFRFVPTKNIVTATLALCKFGNTAVLETVRAQFLVTFRAYDTLDNCLDDRRKDDAETNFFEGTTLVYTTFLHCKINACINADTFTCCLFDI